MVIKFLLILGTDNAVAKLARESHINFISWMHLSPPKIVVYVGSVIAKYSTVLTYSGS